MDPGNILRDVGEDSTAELVESTSADDTAEREPDRESLRRALRDLEAAEARVLRSADRIYDESRSKLVHELLPVLDNLDRTITVAEEHSDVALLQGVRMVRAQLEGVLVRYGVTRVDATGMRFDPEVHEAIAAVPVIDPKYDGVVLQQLEPGYQFNGGLLRPAKVNVGMLQR